VAKGGRCGVNALRNKGKLFSTGLAVRACELKPMDYHMFRFFRCRVFVATMAVGTLICSGCGKTDAPALSQVTGDVVRDQKPIPGAWIEFHPEHGRRSAARTDQNGQFRLMYTESVSGAIPGPHTVLFFLPPESPSLPPAGINEEEKKMFIERNNQPEKLDYEEQVQVGQKGSMLHFDLTGKS